VKLQDPREVFDLLNNITNWNWKFES